MNKFTKKLLNLGNGYLDSEMSFIVESMLRSAAWGVALMLTFLVWSGTLEPGGFWDGILVARFEFAYGAFHLGFGAAGLVSIAKRLSIRILGVPLCEFRGAMTRHFDVTQTVNSMSAAFSLIGALLVSIPFIGLVGGQVCDEAFAVITLIAAAAFGCIGYGMSAATEGRKVVQAMKAIQTR